LVFATSKKPRFATLLANSYELNPCTQYAVTPPEAEKSDGPSRTARLDYVPATFPRDPNELSNCRAQGNALPRRSAQKADSYGGSQPGPHGEVERIPADPHEGLTFPGLRS